MGCVHVDVQQGGLQWGLCMAGLLSSVNECFKSRWDTTGFNIQNILECYRLLDVCLFCFFQSAFNHVYYVSQYVLIGAC